MAIWTNQPKVVKPVVATDTIHVIEFEWNGAVEPLRQSANAAPCGQYPFRDQPLSQFVALARRVVHQQGLNRLPLRMGVAATS
jgi:hypothetical protein